MKTEQFILQEISRIQDRMTMLTREYNNGKVKNLNDKGVLEYQSAVDSLRDAMNFLKSAWANINQQS